MFFEEPTIREQLSKLHKKALKLHGKLRDINTEILMLQNVCSHPGDRITVVTATDGLRDYTSCNDCGKLFE